MLLAPGTRLSRYQLLEPLGRGGMGVVWKARDTDLERDVALKLLPEATRDNLTHRERMLREARAAAAIRHPAICSVYEIDEAEGRTFIAMEYVEGRSLDAFIAEAPIRVEDAIRWGLEILGALEVAHERRIVHRDIKPANVMINSQGQVKLLDFGLARSLPENDPSSDSTVTALTQEHAIIGTPLYMSPEQLRGEEADPRSDLFAFGVVLYEMIAGRHPFRGRTSIDTASSILNREAASITEHRLDTPSWIDAVLRRLLSKEPDSRFAAASEARAAIAAESVSVSPGPSRESSDPSVAVLPLSDMSVDRDQAWFCEGLAEELTNTLMRVEGLRVASRTSAFRLAEGKHDVQEIGRRLRVRTVLEGSVRRAGNRLRITGQLIHAADGYQLWSGRFDRDFSDVFEIQDEIAKAIAEALEVRLLGLRGPAVASPPPVDAYEAYLRGRHLWNKRNERALLQCLDHFRRAIALQPEYATAHAGLADAHYSLSVYGTYPPAEAMARARASAEDALRLDPQCVDARVTLAGVLALHDWQWHRAEESFVDLLRSKARHPTARQWLATSVLLPLGRFEEARAQLAQALESDPLSPVIHCSHALTLHFERRHEEAIEELERVLELDPDFTLARYLLGRAENSLERHPNAIASLERTRAASAGPEITAALAYVLASAGNSDRAREMITALERESATRYVSPALFAPARGELGDLDGAFGALDQAVALRSTELAWLKCSPLVDSLRSDSRFDLLLGRVGLAG